MEIARRLYEDLEHVRAEAAEKQREADETAEAKTYQDAVDKQVARAHALAKRYAKIYDPARSSRFHREQTSPFATIASTESGEEFIQATLRRQETRDTTRGLFGRWKPERITVFWRLQDKASHLTTSQLQPVVFFTSSDIYYYEPEAPDFHHLVEHGTEEWERVDELLIRLELATFDQT